MTLRVGVVAACAYPVPQGSQVYIEQTVRALQLAGHDATLVCYGNGLGNPPPDLRVMRSPRAPFDDRTAAGPSLVKPLLDLLLARTIRSARWDALVAHNYEGLLAALLSGVRPIVYAPHNALSDELPHYFGGAGWAARAGGWLDRTLPRRADAVLALHQRLADYLVAAGCRAERIVVAPPAAPVEAFTGAPPGDDLPFVLYTGNLDRYQNIALLEAAMAMVKQEMPEALLFAVTHGDAVMEDAMTVRALGFATVAEQLANDAILAVPRVSWSGYPIKLLNAFAAGRPAVACASASGPITHEHDGLIVPDDDASAFAGALLRLLRDHDLRQRLGGNARRTAEERLQLSNLAAALDEALRVALESRG